MIKIIARFNNIPNDLKGILWMLSACFWSSVMAVIIRYLSDKVPPLEMVFFRNTSCFILFIPWIKKYGLSVFKTEQLKLYCIRSVSGLMAMSLMFYSLSIIPITDATALTFTTPLITTLLAIFFLNEKMDTYRLCALVSGFIGVLIILRPGTSFQSTYLLVIVTSMFWSVSNILIKQLTKTEPPKKIVATMMLLMTPLSLPGALLTWQTPTLSEVALMFILGVVTNNVQMSLTKAYSSADMGVTMPFDFFRLIFTSIFAYFIFNEMLDKWTALGSIIIFTGSVYVAHREARNRRKAVVV